MAQKLALHGRNHCPNGEDPIPCLGGEVVHLSSWNTDTSSNFPTATWRPVANDTNDSYFEEAFYRGDNWIYDFDTGQVTLAPKAEYHITGWVQWGDDANDGETRIVAVNVGATDRYINTFTFTTSTTTLALLKQPVSMSFQSINLLTEAWLEVWHDHGSDIALVDAEFFVRRHEYVISGNVETRP